MEGRKRVGIVAAATCLVFVVSVIATAATRSQGGPSPDRPAFAQESDGDYLQLRDDYFAHLRGIDPGLYADPRWRTTALGAMQRQQKAELKQNLTTTTLNPNWGQVGPVLVSNGQELSGADTAISGRATAIAVDPTNSNKAYLGTAQGGVGRETEAGR